jgi:hypothetical protein
MNSRTEAVLWILALSACTAGCGAKALTPPEVQVDSQVHVDWRGLGVESGIVLATDGQWVKVRFEYKDESPDGTRLAGAIVEPWVNFERVGHYRITTRR